MSIPSTTPAVIFLGLGAMHHLRRELVAGGADPRRLRTIFGVWKAARAPEVSPLLKLEAIVMSVLAILGVMALPLAVYQLYRSLH